MAVLFIEPFFAFILADFTIRLSNLRNERQISQKLQNFTYFMGLISMVRLLSLLPDLFVKVENAVFINYEGGNYYKLTFSDSIAY